MKKLLLVLAISLAMFSASAATIVTDALTTPQTAAVAANFGSGASAQAVGSDTRVIYLESQTSGLTPISAAVTSCCFEFNNGVSDYGFASVTYLLGTPLVLNTGEVVHFSLGREAQDVAGGRVNFFVYDGSGYTFASDNALTGIMSNTLAVPGAGTYTLTAIGFRVQGAANIDVALNDFSAWTVDPEPPSEVPEPATYALMGLGLAGLAFFRNRK